MKNIIQYLLLPVVIITATAFAAFSQRSNKNQDFRFGLTGGISMPKLKSSNGNELTEGYSSRLATVFGLFFDVKTTKTFSIKTSMNFSGQGGKRNGLQPITSVPPQLAPLVPPGGYLYANFKNEAILNYLEFSMMPKWEWGDKMKFFVNAGPYLGFLLNAKQKTAGTSTIYFDKNGTLPVTIFEQPVPPQSFDASTDVKKDLNALNFGLTGGGGFAFKVGRNSEVLLDLRGAYGLTTLQKDKSNGKSNTGGFFITLGYSVSLMPRY